MRVKDLKLGGHYGNVQKITIYKDYSGDEMMEVQLTNIRTVTRSSDKFEVIEGKIQLGYGSRDYITAEEYNNGNYSL